MSAPPTGNRSGFGDNEACVEKCRLCSAKPKRATVYADKSLAQIDAVESSELRFTARGLSSSSPLAPRPNRVVDAALATTAAASSDRQ